MLRRPGLWAALWLLGLLLSIVGLLPGLTALQTVLGRRPAAAALARGEADALWAEVFADHPTLPVVLFTGAGVALLLYWLLSALLTGGLIAALRRPTAAPSGAVLAEGARLFGGMLRLLLAGWLLRLPVLILGAVAFAVLGGRLQALGLQRAIAASFGVGLALALLWCYASVVLHYAQARLADQPRGERPRALAALRAGLRVAQRGGAARRRTLGLALVSLVGYGALIMSAHLAARAVVAAGFVALALLLRQAFAIGRAVLALTVLAAAVDLAGSEAPPNSAGTA